MLRLNLTTKFFNFGPFNLLFYQKLTSEKKYFLLISYNMFVAPYVACHIGNYVP